MRLFIGSELETGFCDNNVRVAVFELDDQSMFVRSPRRCRKIEDEVKAERASDGSKRKCKAESGLRHDVVVR